MPALYYGDLCEYRKMGNVVPEPAAGFGAERRKSVD